MKRRNIKKCIFIMSIIVTVLVAGCGKKDAPANEESSAEDIAMDEADDSAEDVAEETSSDDSSTETDLTNVEGTQYIYYKDYMSGHMGIDLENGEPVSSEMGNTYDFNTDNLGYYTNGYVGFYFYQVQGDKIATDLFLYDYMVGSIFTVDVMDTNQFSFVYSSGTTDAYADADGVMATGDMTETSITIENDRFNIDSTVKVGDVFNSITQGNHIYLYNVEQGHTGEFSLYDFICLGTYVKQDMDFIESELKVTNWYDPLIGGEYNNCYYENNQPEGDRMSKEQSPKYVKYIPNNGYYVYTEDPDRDPGKDNDFILAEVVTNDQELNSMWSSISIKIRAYKWIDDIGMYAYASFTEGVDSGTLERGLFSNFNYELNEYELVGTVDGDGLITNEVNEDGSRPKARIRMTVNNDGTLTFSGEQDRVSMIWTNPDINTIDYSMGEEGKVFRPIEASVIDSLGLDNNTGYGL